MPTTKFKKPESYIRGKTAGAKAEEPELTLNKPFRFKRDKIIPFSDEIYMTTEDLGQEPVIDSLEDDFSKYSNSIIEPITHFKNLLDRKNKEIKPIKPILENREIKPIERYRGSEKNRPKTEEPLVPKVHIPEDLSLFFRSLVADPNYRSGYFDGLEAFLAGENPAGQEIDVAALSRGTLFSQNSVESIIGADIGLADYLLGLRRVAPSQKNIDIELGMIIFACNQDRFDLKREIHLDDSKIRLEKKIKFNFPKSEKIELKEFYQAGDYHQLMTQFGLDRDTSVAYKLGFVVGVARDYGVALAANEIPRNETAYHVFNKGFKGTQNPFAKDRTDVLLPSMSPYFDNGSIQSILENENSHKIISEDERLYCAGLRVYLHSQDAGDVPVDVVRAPMALETFKQVYVEGNEEGLEHIAAITPEENKDVARLVKLANDVDPNSLGIADKVMLFKEIGQLPDSEHRGYVAAKYAQRLAEQSTQE